jgi:hypothetical protein
MEGAAYGYTLSMKAKAKNGMNASSARMQDGQDEEVKLQSWLSPAEKPLCRRRATERNSLPALKRLTKSD